LKLPVIKGLTLIVIFAPMRNSLKILSVILVFVVASALSPTDVKKSKSIEQLGEKLFFDPILSKDFTISCASCHKPAFAFGDNVAFSKGLGGALTARNTPSVMNVSAFERFFWDGRAKTLGEQALMPIEHPGEMGLPIEEAIERLNNNKVYKKLFEKFFNAPANRENLGKAIAAFQLSLETSSTPFDRWMNGSQSAVSESAKRGRQVFNEKGKCFDCHFGPDFTGDEFRNIGLFDGTTLIDKGRFEVTKDSADLGRFKTPGLRNIAVTAPYMHNGMFATLKEVIDYYDNPAKFIHNSINRDSLLNVPLNLTEQEKADLEEFLHTLTDDRFKR
jgi:cytochrome c peroxidase